MNINLNNSRLNFGAIRVPTNLPDKKAGKKADDACWYIIKEFRPGGTSGLGCHSMFFRDKRKEDLAEQYLINEKVSYVRNDIVDMLDTFAQQEWAHTGKITIE